MPTALDYARRLIAFDSVSSVSNVAVTDEVEGILRGLGCEIERLEYDDANGITAEETCLELYRRFRKKPEEFALEGTP